MGLERQQIEARLREFQRMWRDGEGAAYADFFAADATFLNPVLAEPIRGREALRAFMADLPRLENRTEWLLIEDDRLVFGWNERQDRMRADAPAYRGFSTYVFDDEGLIASYEGMFDPAAVAAATDDASD